mgnify:FL=1
MRFLFDLLIFIVYSLLMIMKNIPTKNEMFNEYNKLKTLDEKIDYMKSIRDMDIHNTLNIEYNNIITKLYSDRHSDHIETIEEDQGVWSEFALEGLQQ